LSGIGGFNSRQPQRVEIEIISSRRDNRTIYPRNSIVPCGTNFILSADTSHFVAG
jgi:hypothetical protein